MICQPAKPLKDLRFPISTGIGGEIRPLTDETIPNLYRFICVYIYVYIYMHIYQYIYICFFWKAFLQFLSFPPRKTFQTNQPKPTVFAEFSRLKRLLLRNGDQLGTEIESHDLTKVFGQGRQVLSSVVTRCAGEI